jgi:hypothetical protein
MNAFEALESRIAIAHPADELHLFAEAQTLFRLDVGSGALADTAIRLHRALLPSHGYQFGETAGRRGLASTWRPDDAHTHPFEAATPALALLRATAHALARQQEADLRGRCSACSGRGWIVRRDGGKTVCVHRDAR